MRQVVKLVRDLAQSDLPVLIVGATGTGKELLAQHLHHWSGRRGSFVDVNCAGLPKELVDGWLFGHRKNAFTGAGDAAPGLIEEAAHGTLFLDEITSLPPEVQAKLLRVLETKEVRRVMDLRKQRISFRVVAAGHEGLAASIAAGTFRRDLYHRLAGAVLRVPSLVERPDDIVPIASYFAASEGRVLEGGVDLVLRAHLWPGNVRELAAVIRRATLLAPAACLPAAAVAEAIALGASSVRSVDSRRARDEARRRAETLAALEASDWRVGCAARSLGIHRVTLYRRALRFGIHIDARK